MTSSGEKDALALQAVLIEWERDGESGELLGSPADLYAEAEHILGSDWFHRRLKQAQAESWDIAHAQMCRIGNKFCSAHQPPYARDLPPGGPDA